MDDRLIFKKERGAPAAGACQWHIPYCRTKWSRT